MNKLWAIPIVTFLVLSIGLFGGLIGSINPTTNEQIIVNSAGFDENNMGFGTSYLNLYINATFLENIESINMDGILHKKDGSYNDVSFNGKPDNGLKNHDYLLEYSSSFMMDSQDIKNMDYLELTIKTTNKEGQNKEIKLNISSDGQVKSNQATGAFGLENQSENLNSNNTTTYDEKYNFKKTNSANEASGISTSQAQNIINNAVEEPGAHAGKVKWDSSVNMWISKIYDKNGKLIDIVGVDSNGHTYRM